ncbi:rRNA adenine N(6)-methyltransferase family protein [Phycicoccus avicenniae]|uniref:rRNA adenine N(6)-methyltransferase family protein n=1 Tax=Phycicoccus avicenniae TaxID=2828860 RepID=UPI003D296F0A
MRASGRRPAPTDWGWHRLSDSWARRVVAAGDVSPGDLVLDPGAGTGVLTRHLLARGARVVAVELHPGRLAALRRIDSPRLTVVRADVRDLRLPREPFRVVGNPPFDGSTALLRRLTARGSRLVGADLVVQRAAAQRWAEGRAPGAGRWAREYSVEVPRSLPRSAFHPRPAVDCAVLQVRRRP